MHLALLVQLDSQLWYRHLQYGRRWSQPTINNMPGYIMTLSQVTAGRCCS